ncbi:MAG: hypothetical protein ACKOSS_02865 [Planctomycetia bacterium]
MAPLASTATPSTAALPGLAPLWAVDLTALPDLAPGTLPWLVAGLALAWLLLRVALLRGTLARRKAAGEVGPVPGPRWIAWLSAQRWALPLLLGLLGLCAAAAVALPGLARR